jgi:hypothetical protein
LIAAGAVLFLSQMHGYSHTSNPDEFGFSSDNHVHEHIRLDQESAALLVKESKRETID